MENTYEIYPIVTCKLGLDEGMFTYCANYGNKVLFPVYAWLIKGGGKPFLIDTGCTYEDMEKHTAIAHTGGEAGPPIEDSLQEMGVSASDIETIILTHIHLDHFLNARKFPNAKLIVQEKELAYARNPHPLSVGIYQPALLEGLIFETIDGDTKIMPGIEAIFTPGHSPGNQSVSITTSQGKAVIVGYCSIDQNFGEKGDIVPGMHTDLFAAYDSMVKIRETADIVIPPHSQRILNVKSIP